MLVWSSNQQVGEQVKEELVRIIVPSIIALLREDEGVCGSKQVCRSVVAKEGH